MGSAIEINDTLQITVEQGFPADILDLKKHLENPIKIEDLKEKNFSFGKKDNARLFQLDPNRIFLVHNIGGKWLFWGKALVQAQTISKKLDSDGNWISSAWETSGTFRIIEIYEPDYQKIFTKRESPLGKSFFD